MSKQLALASWFSLVALLGGCGGGGSGNASESVSPAVSSVNPPATAVGAIVADPVMATFSEPIDSATATINSFTLTGPDGLVSGTVSTNGIEVSFQPDTALAYNTDYQATLTTAIADLVGNQLASAMSWSFNTGRKVVANYVAHTCARADDGRLKCWGSNSRGQLGLGDTDNRGDDRDEMGVNLPLVDLGTGRSVLSVGVGSQHTCALLDDRRVKCWGRNGNGQLGLGDTDDRGDTAGEMGDDLPAVTLGAGDQVLQLMVGNAHNCVRLAGNSVKCWGNNDNGQLGQDNQQALGDDAGEMGGALPTVALGSGRNVSNLIAADRYNCALLDNGDLKCWGINTDGDLGLGDTNDRGDGLEADRVTPLPGGTSEMGDNLPAVDFGAVGTLVTVASDEHNCALFDDGSVKCWGGGSSGRLGNGASDDIGDEAGEMGDNLPFVDLGTDRTAVALTAGSRHQCAVLDDQSLKCWGSGSSGQLGQDNRDTLGDDPGEMGDSLPTIDLGTGLTVRELTAGDTYSCAYLSDDSIKCWGSNFAGQLGLGDTVNRGNGLDAIGDPLAMGSSEMGDSLPAVNLGF